MNRLAHALLWTGLATSPLAAADQRLWLGGFETADDAFYSYAGLVTAPARGRGLVQRYWLDHFGYEYDGGPGRVAARAWGAEAALGYSRSSAAGWGTASLGLRFTDTTLSPGDPGASARGGQWAARLQLEGEREIAPHWRAAAIASITTRQDEYWLRLRIMRHSDRVLAPGFEVVAGGNSETHSRAAGLVLALRPAGRAWSVALKGGLRRQDGDDSAYAGIEFVR